MFVRVPYVCLVAMEGREGARCFGARVLVHVSHHVGADTGLISSARAAERKEESAESRREGATVFSRETFVSLLLKQPMVWNLSLL